MKQRSRETAHPGLRKTGHSRALVRTIGLLCFAGMLGGSGERCRRTRANRQSAWHDRLTGAFRPPDAELTQMQTLIAQGNPTGAANIAMSASSFYTVTLKNFAAPATNRAQSVFVPLNDYATATVIGMIRDGVYAVQPGALRRHSVRCGQGISGLPAYSPTNNNHYQFLDDNNVDLSSKSKFVQTTQSSVTGIPLRRHGGDHHDARHRRRLLRRRHESSGCSGFTLINHLCNDMPAGARHHAAARIASGRT